MTADTFAGLLASQPRLGVHFAQSLGSTDTSTRLTGHLSRRLQQLPAFSGPGHRRADHGRGRPVPPGTAVGRHPLQVGRAAQRPVPGGRRQPVPHGGRPAPMLIEDSVLLGGENLASDIPYNHTVVAEEPTLCWELSRNDFHRINQVHPVLQRALNRPAIPVRPDTAATPRRRPATSLGQRPRAGIAAGTRPGRPCPRWSPPAPCRPGRPSTVPGNRVPSSTWSNRAKSKFPPRRTSGSTRN